MTYGRTNLQTLTFNSGNQVTTSGNSYDARGNQTATSDPSGTTMGYNGASQMTTATPSGGSATSYEYSSADQSELTTAGPYGLVVGLQDQYGVPQVQSWTKGGTTTYVERDGEGSPVGLRIGGADYAFVTDGLGSVVAVVSAADKKVKASYTYDPWGQLTAADETGLGVTNLVRYAGGTYDPATSFTHFGARWYNPTQGRFTQQDSLAFLADPTNGNRYAYAADNPTNNIDPTGRTPATCLGAGLVAVGGFITLASSSVIDGPIGLLAATAFITTGSGVLAERECGLIPEDI